MRRLIAILLALIVTSATAIEPPKQDKPPPSTTPPPPTAPAPETAGTEATTPVEPEAAKPEPEEEETLPPLPAGTVPSGPPPARFNPTEKVRADFPVSFPIDI